MNFRFDFLFDEPLLMNLGNLHASFDDEPCVLLARFQDIRHDTLYVRMRAKRDIRRRLGSHTYSARGLFDVLNEVSFAELVERVRHEQVALLPSGHVQKLFLRDSLTDTHHQQSDALRAELHRNVSWVLSIGV